MSDSVASWDAVADRYAAYWGPRFAPFLEQAFAGFDPPPGDLVVPGAGPGDEVALLAAAHPARRVWALEPAPNMLALLQARGLPSQVEVRAARATQVSEHVSGAGGFASSFVLQLLPDRAAALRDWRRAAQVGAQARIVFWPQQLAGAWCRLGEALESATGRPRPAWEQPLAERLPELGWRLERAVDLVHPIVHADVDEAWERLVDSCSLQSLLRRAGPEAVARAERAWKANPGLDPVTQGVAHTPTARLWQLLAL